MRIIVPIKQVPETQAVRMDEETGTVIREGVASIINPLDLYAIELAVSLCEAHGGESIAITMGPAAAAEALREAMSMGIDKGVLVSDKAFAGSDTWATAYVLAEAVRETGDFDLIICGERATDGDTGQVGPEIAAYLDLPVATYVGRVDALDSSTVQVARLVEGGHEVLDMALPGLLTVVKEVGHPRLPTLRGKQRSRTVDIPVFGLPDLELDQNQLGLTGSPTRVAKIFRPRVMRECELLNCIDDAATAKAAARFRQFLEANGIINEMAG